MEYLQVDGSLTKVTPIAAKPSQERLERLENISVVLRFLGRKVLPAATAAFVVVYWIVASVAYFSPSLQFGDQYI